MDLFAQKVNRESKQGVQVFTAIGYKLREVTGTEAVSILFQVLGGENLWLMRLCSCTTAEYSRNIELSHGRSAVTGWSGGPGRDIYMYVSSIDYFNKRLFAKPLYNSRFGH